MADSSPSPILQYLVTALDHKLADLPSDHRKTVFLAQAYGNWAIHYGKFMRDCSQPFGGPHPMFGAMTMWDFRLLLCEIEKRQREVGRIAA